MGDKARLNYVIPNDLEERLDVYCRQTGRTPTDVVRQLVCEWLEHDRHLEKAASEHPDGRRTNLLLTHQARTALEDRIIAEGHATVSAVVEALLRPFLASRAPGAVETVTLRLPVPVDLYNDFATMCSLTATTVEVKLVDHIRARVEEARAAIQQQKES